MISKVLQPARELVEPKEKVTLINKDKLIKVVKFIGLGFLEPLVRIGVGEEPRKNALLIVKSTVFPVCSILLFLVLWHYGAAYLFNVEANIKIEAARAAQGEAAALAMKECIASGDLSCKPNVLPSPSEVYEAAVTLWQDHLAIMAKKVAFSEKVAETNASRQAQGLEMITYTGRPSFIDQIKTSILTVFAGFLLAMVLAVPAGVLMGLSTTLRTSFNWLIQILKPVSPVVWLLLVFMIVKTLIKDPSLDKSFIISFVSVGLCSMWATLVNTSLGVSSVDKDFVNVARVLKLGIGKNIRKIVLPFSFPYIFTGLRITISVAWMVLIAIELLAQSPGLGSFVWEEFQNGANDSNAKILVAMIVIGLIGFLLDRLMVMLQRLLVVSKSEAS